MVDLEILSLRYSRGGFRIDLLHPPEVDLIEKIVSGEVPSEQLPKSLEHTSEGFSADYNRTIAVEVLQILDVSRSFEPILSWLKDLAEKEGYRHWTSCMEALDRFAVFFEMDIQRNQLERAIPYLKTIAMDFDPKDKGYQECALSVLDMIGGANAKAAIQYVMENTTYPLAKKYAQQILADNKELRSSKNHTQNKSVLVADDNEDIRSSLVEIIHDTYSVRVNGVSDGEEAVEMAKQNEYTIILMDFTMPRLNGVEATKRIREFSQVPIYLVTGNELNEEKWKSVGATGYILKDPLGGLDAIEKILDKHLT